VSALALKEVGSTSILFSVSMDDTVIRVWDLNTLKCIRTLQSDMRLFCLTFSPTLNRLYGGSLNDKIEVWDVSTYELIGHMEGHSGDAWVYSLRLSEDEKRLYSAAYDETVKIWDTASNTCLATLIDHSQGVTGLCLSNEFNRLVSSSWGGNIKVWDLNSNTCIVNIEGAHCGNGVFCLALSSTRGVVCSGVADAFGNGNYSIHVWKLTHTMN
jgi:WD40 repeat protein